MGTARARVTNPNSSLTDFSLIVDLSTLPASWWNDVDTTDGTKGRVFKGDGVTELAVDWIDFNPSTNTGLLRILWSGVLGTIGTHEVIIHSPKASNSSYGANHTYGQYNAYDSNWEVYYPLIDLNDRTINAKHLTLQGEASLQPGTGYYGGQLSLDGSGDYASADNITATDLTAITTYKATWGYWGGPLTQIFRNINNNNLSVIQGSSDSNTPRINAEVGTGNNGDNSQWNFIAGTICDNDAYIHINGSEIETSYYDSTPIAERTNIKITIGRGHYNSYTTGLIGATSLHSIKRSQDWVSYEYSQTSDNTTFWGEWTYESDSSGYDLVSEPVVALSTVIPNSLNISIPITGGLGSSIDSIVGIGSFTTSIPLLSSEVMNLSNVERSSIGITIPLVSSEVLSKSIVRAVSLLPTTDLESNNVKCPTRVVTSSLSLIIPVLGQDIHSLTIIEDKGFSEVTITLSSNDILCTTAVNPNNIINAILLNGASTSSYTEIEVGVVDIHIALISNSKPINTNIGEGELFVDNSSISYTLYGEKININSIINSNILNKIEKSKTIHFYASRTIELPPTISSRIKEITF